MADGTPPGFDEYMDNGQCYSRLRVRVSMATSSGSARTSSVVSLCVTITDRNICRITSRRRSHSSASKVHPAFVRARNGQLARVGVCPPSRSDPRTVAKDPHRDQVAARSLPRVYRLFP